MIDLIIAYFSLIVVILLFIIAFLTLYIIYERRKISIIPLNKDKKVILPLLTFKTNDKSSGDHSNSATTHKRMTKRLRNRVKFIRPMETIRTQNSHGFLILHNDLSTRTNQLSNSRIDQTTIHFDS